MDTMVLYVKKTISRYCPFKKGRTNTTYSVFLFNFLMEKNPIRPPASPYITSGRQPENKQGKSHFQADLSALPARILLSTNTWVETNLVHVFNSFVANNTLLNGICFETYRTNFGKRHLF
jgi:hypothetical protein